MRPLALLTAVGVESTAGAFPHLLALHMTASALLGDRPSAGQRRSIRSHEPRLQPDTALWAWMVVFSKSVVLTLRR